MAGSVNKVILVGNLGRDPEVRSFQSGDKVCNLSIATSETWKDRASGERKEKTEWHRVAIYNQNLVTICEKYLTKGSKVYIEGKLETREYEKDGEKRYSTEITIRNFGGELTLLDGKGGNSEPSQDRNKVYGDEEYNAIMGKTPDRSSKPLEPDLDIPF